MIISMTGFGRAEISEQGYTLTAEIRSVNHRYQDISLHMPRKFAKFEADIRKLIQSYTKRGKIDVSLFCKNEGLADTSLKYHPEFAKQYVEYFEKMTEEFGLENDLTASKLAQLPDVFTLEENETDEKVILELAEKVIRSSAEQLKNSRQTEGTALKKDILGKLDILEENVLAVQKRYPQIISEYKQRLLAKLEEVKADTTIDDARLASELILYSDRLSTDEETVRLLSHIRTMRQTLEKGGEAGRRLDFIAQEMNREANTILSKANDLKTSEIGIEMKTNIEKIREQIQNIE